MGSTRLAGLGAALISVAMQAAASAQQLEPRAYSPGPVGAHFAGLTYLHSRGGVAVDASLPLKNVNAEINSAAVSYATTFGLFGRTASAGFILPYARADVSADVFNEQRAVTRTGLANSAYRVAVNLIGGPALDMELFAAAPPRTTLGTSLTVFAPTGQYDGSRLVNLGSNRWAFKPELGLYQPFGPWTVELAAGGFFFTANDDFFGGSRRTQDPLALVQAHVSYVFAPRLWISANAIYYAGGRTTVDGSRNADRQENTRVGLTLSLPLWGANSLKLAWAEGVTTRIGSSFTTFLVTLQFAWFE